MPPLQLEDLLLRERFYLKRAADRLADELGEFRTNMQEYRLRGIAQPGGLVAEEAKDPNGLMEDEFQLLINLLGEHLREGQLMAIFAVIEQVSSPASAARAPLVHDPPCRAGLETFLTTFRFIVVHGSRSLCARRSLKRGERASRLTRHPVS